MLFGLWFRVQRSHSSENYARMREIVAKDESETIDTNPNENKKNYQQQVPLREAERHDKHELNTN